MTTPECHNSRHHYFMKIRLVGWMLRTLVKQHAIEVFGSDLDSRVTTCESRSMLSIWLVESMQIYPSRIDTYLKRSTSKLNSSEVETRNSFCVMSANAFQAKIDSAIMFVRKVKLSPSVFLAHAKALANSTAKYPIQELSVKLSRFQIRFEISI